MRELIRIDEERCDGCGLCVPACAEGAIAVIDGKARLVSGVYCDGMGACLGHCPQGAITVERVAARAYDEKAVEEHLRRGARPAAAEPAPAGRAGLPVVAGPARPAADHAGGSCPGSRAVAFARPAAPPTPLPSSAVSELGHWPVQLHLVSPSAPFFRGARVLLAADCVAFAVGDFHTRFLAGHSLAIACPKLDSHQEVYLDKLVALIDQAEIASLEVVIMQVPCCAGLLGLARRAVERASRSVPLSCTVIGVRGEVLATSAA